MKKDEYDVIIIGAGIGGLVCGNYLAKAGKKVLIIEKNREPGGYCTSFKRRNFIFDTTIHAIQNCGPNNILNEIFFELDIINKMEIIRHDPTDTVLTPECKIDIRNDISHTISNFQTVFPHQSHEIKDFFNLVSNKDFTYIYPKFKKYSFGEVLNSYFSDQKLKTIIGIFLANIGSSPSNTSAVSGFALLKQFILSGGYYLKGGMQVLPNTLKSKFEEYGGVVLLKKLVEEITIRKGKVQGVKLKSGELFKSKLVVSNSDLTYTITNLLKGNGIEGFCSLKKRLNNLPPSSSIFIIYLALNKNLNKIIDSGPGLWYIPEERMIRKINIRNQNIMTNKTIFYSIASKLDSSMLPPNSDVVRIMINTNYFDTQRWTIIGKPLVDRLLKQTEEIIPNFLTYINCIGRATPITMRNYTFNREGSMCGWLNSIQQVNNPITKYLPSIQGLFYVGHWVTQKYGNGGIAMVADSGRRVSKIILRNSNK